MEDWAPPNLSPRTFMSNFLNEEFSSKSFPDLLAGNGSDRSIAAAEKQDMPMKSKEEFDDDGFNFSTNGALDGSKSSSRGGLAQRIARAGFNAPTINTARIKSANMASSSLEVHSPYLTIPPGLSPTTLLDSPVFLSNSMAQPSPTTGKISFMSNGSNSLSVIGSSLTTLDKGTDGNSEDVTSGGFAFKPHLNMISSYYSSLENKGSADINSKQSVQSTNFSFGKNFNSVGISESTDRINSADGSIVCPRPTDPFAGNEHSPPLDEQLDGEEDTKGESSSLAAATPAEDGFNWRKYGQKHVKGSEYPRSYYKCTHQNCQVKKKVERSLEGHITEIIYKGTHNHAKPLPNRRSGGLASHQFNDGQMDGLEHSGSQASFGSKPPLWAGDGMETMSSASIAADFGDQDGSQYESPEAIEISSTVSNEEEEEDQVTHGNVPLGGDAEGDDNDSKRRKLDACSVEMNTASRAVREPRVVVQTTSEVDILDDGYRWRKYGQKVVKGNPNPRSYYKCTSPGCTVRKHVERASHDLKSVITTYEGKHNHDVPVARNNGHSGSGASTTAAASAAHPHTFHRRPEAATQDSLMQFSQQLGLGPGFSFGMGPPNLSNLGLGGLGHMGQLKMPVLGQMNSYMGQQVGSGGVGFVIPKGELKEELMSTNSGLPVSNAMAAYHQLISRLPLGPPL